jgi:hypothetical protein
MITQLNVFSALLSNFVYETTIVPAMPRTASASNGGSQMIARRPGCTANRAAASTLGFMLPLTKCPAAISRLALLTKMRPIASGCGERKCRYAHGTSVRG